MPTPYIKKIAKKKHKSVASVEKDWKRAKEIAAEGGHSGDFGVVTGIFKKMLSEGYDVIFKDQPHHM